MNKVDPITTEIIGNLLLSIAEEMGHVITRSAYSTNIKERKDLSTAVFDGEGNMVAQAELVAMHLGSLLGIVKEVLNQYDLEKIYPGDMFISNDPYGGGGTHLPDITIVAPVFEENRIIAWVANLAHHSDVGGKVPGSTSGDADSIFQEGLKIPIIKIINEYQLNEDTLRFITSNSRLPIEREGDMKAQIAANKVAIKRVKAAYERYGDVLINSMKDLQEYAYQKLKSGISKLPDGVYEFKDFMDDGGVASPDPIPICVSIEISGDNMVLDFAGTSKQVKGPINVTRNGLLATVFYSLKALIDPLAPSNAGIYRAFEVKCEKGLIINATQPAAVGARIDTCQRVVDVIFGALADVVPERAMACSNSSVTTATFSGNDSNNGNFYVYLETIAGGSGATKDNDGLSGVQVHMTNTSNLPVEALEMEYPLLTVKQYKLREDSGGPGKNRGGLGILREFEVNFDNISFTGLGDRHKFAPWGIKGGKEGATGKNLLIKNNNEEIILPSKCSNIELNKGDIVKVFTPGSGGYGNPMEREPELVLKDVIEEKVSLAKAKECYGVVINEKDNGFDLDIEKTKELRKRGA